MKRFPLAVAAALLGLSLWTQPAAAEIKIGYIDSEVLRDRLPEFQSIQRQFERLKQRYEQEAIDRQSTLKKLEDDFRKQELLMSEARKAEMMADYESKVQALQQFTQEKLGPNGELFRKNVELTQPVFEQINTALEALAQEEGYDFIFDVAGNGTIVYADPDRYNLTEKLLEKLEEARDAREKGQQ